MADICVDDVEEAEDLLREDQRTAKRNDLHR